MGAVDLPLISIPHSKMTIKQILNPSNLLKINFCHLLQSIALSCHYYFISVAMSTLRSAIFVLFVTLFCFCHSKSVVNHLMAHHYSIELSQEISNKINEQLVNNLHRIANLTAVDLLRQDLTTGSRNMKVIDAVTTNQIFGIFGLNDPHCDVNEDGYIEQTQLKCLNKIWKYYVPESAEDRRQRQAENKNDNLDGE